MGNHSAIINTVELNGYTFTVECDVEGILERIERIKDQYNESLYGYYSLSTREDITEEEYQNNIAAFIEGLNRRITKEYTREIVEKALKKKDGTFHKSRTYDELPLENAEEGSAGMSKYYQKPSEI